MGFDENHIIGEYFYTTNLLSIRSLFNTKSPLVDPFPFLVGILDFFIPVRYTVYEMRGGPIVLNNQVRGKLI